MQGARGKGKWPAEAQQVLVMKWMGWSWRQLQNCPAELYDRILVMMEGEAIAAKERQK